MGTCYTHTFSHATYWNEAVGKMPRPSAFTRLLAGSHSVFNNCTLLTTPRVPIETPAASVTRKRMGTTAPLMKMLVPLLLTGNRTLQVGIRPLFDAAAY